MSSKSSAIAHSNIAFIKFWGRAPQFNPALNIPLNDTVSMTKLGSSPDMRLQTHTTIEFSSLYGEDMAYFEGVKLAGRAIERVLRVVAPLRRMAGSRERFMMKSQNDFPTQAGLASSAAGFAALTLATSAALGLDLTKEELTTYARLGSGSAARSIHGGFVYWHKGRSHKTSFAEPICGPNDFDINAVIAIINDGKKEVTSDLGQGRARTSVFNSIRITTSQRQARAMRKAILDDDLAKVGTMAEDNCRMMHAVMMTSEPPLFYWDPATLRVIKAVLKARAEDALECYFTIDAGPNVHCLCRPEDAPEVKKMLDGIKEVTRTVVAGPAQDSHVTKEHLF
jgi:diphosphomevalonate decarboxylase